MLKVLIAILICLAGCGDTRHQEFKVVTVDGDTLFVRAATMATDGEYTSFWNSKARGPILVLGHIKSAKAIMVEDSE